MLNNAAGSRAQKAKGPPSKTKGRCVKYPSGTAPMLKGINRFISLIDGELVTIN